MIEVRIIPERRSRNSGRVEKASVLRMSHLTCGQVEDIGPNAMHGTLVLLARLRAHPEPARGNEYKLWFDRLSDRGFYSCTAHVVDERSTKLEGRSSSRSHSRHKPFCLAPSPVATL